MKFLPAIAVRGRVYTGCEWEYHIDVLTSVMKELGWTEDDADRAIEAGDVVFGTAGDEPDTFEPNDTRTSIYKSIDSIMKYAPLRRRSSP